MIKILMPNKDGKIELTKEELEDLLKEAETEGYMHGVKEARAELIPEQSKIFNNLNKDDFKWDDRYCKLSEEERRKMFYVDYENLPKYDSDPYEKIPYWLRPGFQLTPSCNYTDPHSTAGASPDLTSVTTCGTDKQVPGTYSDICKSATTGDVLNSNTIYSKKVIMTK